MSHNTTTAEAGRAGRAFNLRRILHSPLALPLIWWHPKMTRAWKIGLTIIIFVFSWILIQLSIESLRTIKEYYQLLESL